MFFENLVARDRAVVFDHFPHIVLEETFQFFLLCLHERGNQRASFFAGGVDPSVL